MPEVFVSWSGGKDCCLACYRAMSRGLSVRYLANTVSADGLRSCSHGISAVVIKAQAEAIGIPIIQQRTTGDTYEAVFIKMLRSFRAEGIEDGVFGDIDFNPHREWIERVCREAGITPHLPLWLEDQHDLMMEFIDSGFEAVVVAAKEDIFGEEVLGQKIDKNFVRLLEGLNQSKGITFCGEAGEYHTLVVNGPIFQKPLKILETRKTKRDGIHFLEILRTE